MYGAVTMNNTMCLGIFLLVVHAKHLEWTYTSEVLVTVGEPIIPQPLSVAKHTRGLLQHCLLALIGPSTLNALAT